jgi:hypothetical protein
LPAVGNEAKRLQGDKNATRYSGQFKIIVMKKFQVWEGGSDCDGIYIEPSMVRKFETLEEAEAYLAELKESTDGGISCWIMRQDESSAERIA